MVAYFSQEKRLGCFVDTSVLFSQTYPLDAFNEESEQAFDILSEQGVFAFKNINVRAEFLENHRRVLIAECLIDILESWGYQMDGPLSEKLKSHKTGYRKKIQEEKSAKMELSQIKVFRRLLSERILMGKNGWIAFCENFLHGIGSNDAMILNMFFCSKVPAFLTADTELAEVAAMEAKKQKQIFVPDSLIRP